VRRVRERSVRERSVRVRVLFEGALTGVCGRRELEENKSCSSSAKPFRSLSPSHSHKHTHAHSCALSSDAHYYSHVLFKKQRTPRSTKTRTRTQKHPPTLPHSLSHTLISCCLTQPSSLTLSHALLSKHCSPGHSHKHTPTHYRVLERACERSV
jgi:hypothetical protein